jgi:N-ethylmaleimide reductase
MQIPVPHRELGKIYDNGHIIANLKTVREAYSAFINEEVDLISFGKYWVSNPDLVERLRNNISLAEPDESTYYTQDEKGFTDYPSANN